MLGSREGLTLWRLARYAGSAKIAYEPLEISFLQPREMILSSCTSARAASIEVYRRASRLGVASTWLRSWRPEHIVLVLARPPATFAVSAETRYVTGVTESGARAHRCSKTQPCAPSAPNTRTSPTGHPRVSPAAGRLCSVTSISGSIDIESSVVFTIGPLSAGPLLAQLNAGRSGQAGRIHSKASPNAARTACGTGAAGHYLYRKPAGPGAKGNPIALGDRG